VQSEPDDTPVLFENLRNPRLAEVAKDRKLNVWILTCMNKRSAITCGRYTSLAKGTASVKLAGRAKRATAAKLKALEPGAYGEVWHRCDKQEGVTEEEWLCAVEGFGVQL